jgi:cytochrome oxidase Cu insertion factor (SCO1/SenC/PrrC family)
LTSRSEIRIAKDAAFSKTTSTHGKSRRKPTQNSHVLSPQSDHTLRNLSVGRTAPEITGQDVDGKTFKLSDYRGKVVLLDFWGHW